MDDDEEDDDNNKDEKRIIDYVPILGALYVYICSLQTQYIGHPYSSSLTPHPSPYSANSVDL